MLHCIVRQPEGFFHGESAGVQKLQEHFNISAHDTVQDYVFLGKTIVIYEAGGPEKLVYTEVPVPEVKPGWSLVRIIGRGDGL